MRRLLLATLAMLFLLVGQAAVAAPVPVPALTARVTDQTGTLDASQQQSLESILAAFEKSKGSQIAILIVPTTGDETIEQYSIRVVDAWKLGRKKVDDGILVLVAKNDHKVRIEVGRGLEGAVPDALANRIIDEAIVPKFKQGDFAGGLDDGVARLIGLVNGEPLPPPAQDDSGSDGANAFGAALVAFMIARGLLGAVREVVRGSIVGVVVGVVAMVAGASMGLAGILAVLAFVLALPSLVSGGRYTGGGGSSGGSWGGWGGGSSGGSWGGFGGGGGGFSGGGGGFSGGGASGGW